MTLKIIILLFIINYGICIITKWRQWSILCIRTDIEDYESNVKSYRFQPLGQSYIEVKDFELVAFTTFSDKWAFLHKRLKQLGGQEAVTTKIVLIENNGCYLEENVFASVPCYLVPSPLVSPRRNSADARQLDGRSGGQNHCGLSSRCPTWRRQTAND